MRIRTRVAKHRSAGLDETTCVTLSYRNQAQSLHTRPTGDTPGPLCSVDGDDIDGRLWESVLGGHAMTQKQKKWVIIIVAAVTVIALAALSHFLVRNVDVFAGGQLEKSFFINNASYLLTVALGLAVMIAVFLFEKIRDQRDHWRLVREKDVALSVERLRFRERIMTKFCEEVPKNMLVLFEMRKKFIFIVESKAGLSVNPDAPLPRNAENVDFATVERRYARQLHFYVQHVRHYKSLTMLVATNFADDFIVGNALVIDALFDRLNELHPDAGRLLDLIGEVEKLATLAENDNKANIDTSSEESPIVGSPTFIREQEKSVLMKLAHARRHVRDGQRDGLHLNRVEATRVGAIIIDTIDILFHQVSNRMRELIEEELRKRN
ncbi:MAG: hypothetical protein AAF663_06295 [Planctomycetota bacterium]